MSVLRVVANLPAADPAAGRAFYCGVLGMEAPMDMGWIVTFAAPGVEQAPQLSLMSEGGGGAPVPPLSVEVDDVDAAYERAVAAGFEITRALADEPWGVRRFFVRGPAGEIVNVLAHIDAGFSRPE
ncbi:glyoxalase [Pikeienuella piscinae]|uniref:Glyoxalase n=1 Tax=Pikeienuella piscinae TaxID=2748098 RepID=A0A7M3T593_9RHOB|nr:VOC family protein [Pikeienuella piscinae]QIE57174.1 glyoxalase [Pikeienuella piscinae]